MIYFWHRIKDTRIVMWNTIHDSIASRVHRDEIELYKEISKQSFTYDVYNYLRTVYNYEFTIPLGVGVKVGEHWGEAEVEEVWDVHANGDETYKRK